MSAPCFSAYMQEIGRSGRDGEQASATLYYNASDIATNKKHLTKEVREYCQLKTCRRKFLIEYFEYELDHQYVSISTHVL